MFVFSDYLVASCHFLFIGWLIAMQEVEIKVDGCRVITQACEASAAVTVPTKVER